MGVSLALVIADARLSAQPYSFCPSDLHVAGLSETCIIVCVFPYIRCNVTSFSQGKMSCCQCYEAHVGVRN